MRLNKKGSLTILLVVLLLVCTWIFFGLIELNTKLNRSIQHQLQLDRCTGTLALAAKKDIREIWRINTLMKAARATILTVIIRPSYREELKLALKLMKIRQKIIRTKWEIRRLIRTCQIRGAWILDYPPFPFEREEDDWIGPKPLSQTKESLRFSILSQTRSSHSLLSNEEIKWITPNEAKP